MAGCGKEAVPRIIIQFLLSPSLPLSLSTIPGSGHVMTRDLITRGGVKTPIGQESGYFMVREAFKKKTKKIEKFQLRSHPQS